MSVAARRAERLVRARALVASLEAGRDAEADALALELAGADELGTELGRMTRDLHDALESLRVDPRISELANDEIPDAREKLSWVLALTEQAAHTVINAVEQGLPLTARLVAPDGGYPPAVREDGQRLHDLLSEILMAQSFQDLTGQAIRRVIEVSGEMERRLADLVQCAGPKPAAVTKIHAKAPGSERIQGQDEVDDLLSGLGF